MKSLSQQQEQFVRLVILGLPKRTAAIRAGYSARSASTTASTLSRYPQVQHRLQELRGVVADALRQLDSEEVEMRAAALTDLATVPHQCRSSAGVSSKAAYPE